MGYSKQDRRKLEDVPFADKIYWKCEKKSSGSREARCNGR